MPEGPTVVEISDPVAHAKYIFVLGDSVVHRQQLPINADAQAATVPAESPRQRSVEVALATQPTIGALGLLNTPDNNALKTISSDKKCPVVPAAQQAAEEESLPKTTVDALGTQIIEGIPAEGTRSTTTYPVDSVGNDRPITSSFESWHSLDLNEDILTKSNDPRNGEHTHKLINISRSEPDPSLFEPPPGYTEKSEQGAFTLNWNSPR
jgi:chemotaxis response regulator CheB